MVTSSMDVPATVESICKLCLFAAARATATSPSGSKTLHGTDRTEKDRCLPFRAKKVDRTIQLRRVNQATGTNLDMLIGFVVQSDGRVVVHTSGQIGEMRRRQRLAGQLLELHHAKSLIGALRWIQRLSQIQAVLDSPDLLQMLSSENFRRGADLLARD